MLYWALNSLCCAVLPPVPLPKPGVGITAVSRCIWFAGVPAHIGEADLFKEASLMGDVQFILFPDCPGRDEALVTFASFGYGFLSRFVALGVTPDQHAPIKMFRLLAVLCPHVS